MSDKHSELAMRVHSRIFAGAALVLLGVLGGCSDEPLAGPQASGLVEPTAIPDPVTMGVEASLSAEPYYDGEQVLRVRLDGLSLGSYQARLRFDPKVLTLIEVLPREGGRPSGEFHVVNAGSTDLGEVRFAGFTVRGFGGDEMLVLRFSAPRAITPDQVHLELEVAGTLKGEPVRKTQLSVLRGAFAKRDQVEQP